LPHLRRDLPVSVSSPGRNTSPRLPPPAPSLLDHFPWLMLWATEYWVLQHSVLGFPLSWGVEAGVGGFVCCNSLLYTLLASHPLKVLSSASSLLGVATGIQVLLKYVFFYSAHRQFVIGNLFCLELMLKTWVLNNNFFTPC
jgi:hypothetical protein